MHTLVRLACRYLVVAAGLVLMTACLGDTPIPSALAGPGSSVDPVLQPIISDAQRATMRRAGIVLTRPAPRSLPGGLRKAGTPLDNGQEVDLDFEGLGAFVVVGETYAALGAIFSNADVMDTMFFGGNSNYPPHSGSSEMLPDQDGNDPIVRVSLSAPVASVGVYATSYFPVTMTCYDDSGTAVGADSMDYTYLSFSIYFGGLLDGTTANHHLQVIHPGIRSCGVGGTAKYYSLDDFEFNKHEGADSVSITQVHTTYGDTSFVTIPGENTVQLSAKLGNPADTGTIHWDVKDDTTDFVDSGTLTPPSNGPNVTLTIVAPPAPVRRFTSGPSRWYSVLNDEPGPLAKKALSYVIRAYSVSGVEDTVWSQPVTLRQKPVDVLRQEYVDWSFRHIPGRAELQDLGGGRYYSTSDLIQGSDYIAPPSAGPGSLGWVRPELLQGLDSMRVLYGADKAMAIRSGWRNPVHNWVHLRLRQNLSSAWFSRHQVGGAVDLQTGGNKEVFYSMSRAGSLAGACMEPPQEWIEASGLDTGQLSVMGYDHVHAEWDSANSCPPTMAAWGRSLLSAN